MSFCLQRQTSCLMGSNEIFSNCKDILMSFRLQRRKSIAAALQQQTGLAAPKHLFNGKQWDFQQLQGYSDVLAVAAPKILFNWTQ